MKNKKRNNRNYNVHAEMLICSYSIESRHIFGFYLGTIFISVFCSSLYCTGHSSFFPVKKKTWGIHIIAAWLIINVILTSVLSYLLFIIETGPKGIICPATFIITGILSIISVIYLCHKAKDEMKFDKEIKRILETHD